jgi:hypothetical protein
MVAQRSGVLVEILMDLPCVHEVEGEALVLELRNWIPARSIAPRMTPSYLFMAGNV